MPVLMSIAVGVLATLTGFTGHAAFITLVLTLGFLIGGEK